ncbi:MAG: electron transfer flavoprotein subunit beta/FixA family protein [Coriobacteriia bacterium]|nr:electron transfer flavoprotein subunit beta/FixA family protein [Coriobacteriia bacterium]
MNILVCIKQVPASSDVNIDEETGTIIRDGVDSKMNPYDLYALELGLQLKEQYGGCVDVVSMGPPQANEVLEEAIAIGADKGSLLSDRAFAGADVLATSYTLAQGIESLGNYDLILCGKQTTDGDTAQVGAEIAEFLDFDHATNILNIDNVSDSGVSVQMNLGDVIYHQDMKFPCVLTIEKDINTPRLPSYKRKCQLDETKISMSSLADFKDQDKMHYGLNGSPTSVEKVFPPDKNTEQETFTGTPEEMAIKLVNEMKDLKLI